MKTLEQRTKNTQRTSARARSYVECNAGYEGCLGKVPKRDALCIEGVGLSCTSCYEEYLHTQD